MGKTNILCIFLISKALQLKVSMSNILIFWTKYISCSTDKINQLCCQSPADSSYLSGFQTCSIKKFERKVSQLLTFLLFTNQKTLA